MFDEILSTKRWNESHQVWLKIIKMSYNWLETTVTITQSNLGKWEYAQAHKQTYIVRSTRVHCMHEKWWCKAHTHNEQQKFVSILYMKHGRAKWWLSKKKKNCVHPTWKAAQKQYKRNMWNDEQNGIKLCVPCAHFISTIWELPDSPNVNHKLIDTWNEYSKKNTRKLTMDFTLEKRTLVCLFRFIALHSTGIPSFL